MIHVPSTLIGMAGSRFGAAVWIGALALLVACGGAPPSESSGIDVGLGTSSIAILRGASAEVEVDLTRVGGAAEPTDLSVTGLPAGVTATFSPATLEGATLTSTLTVIVTAAASEGISSLTVAASSGSLSDEASLSLDVTSLTVQGRVEGMFGQPIEGATVASQDRSVSTDFSGTFVLTGLAVPYDLVVTTGAGGGTMHVYEGMMSAAPLVRPTFEPSADPSFYFARSAALTGTVLGGLQVAASQIVVVCIEGLTKPLYGCSRAFAGETGYSFDAFWSEGATASARIHALHFEFDADGFPLAYVGYESIDIDLEDGAPEVRNLSMDAVASTSLTGSVAIPEGFEPNVFVFPAVRFGPNLAMLVTQIVPATDFTVLVPEIPGITYDLGVSAKDALATSYAWRRDVGTNAETIDVAAPFATTAPVDGATGVELATPFISDGDGARTFVWVPNDTGPTISLTTLRSQVTMPDPSPLFVLPDGASYAWGVYGHATDRVDEAASGGLADYIEFLLLLNGSSGGPGFGSDRDVSLSAVRGFTLSP